MNIGGRNIRTIASALFQRRHYKAAINMLRLYEKPFDAYARYLLKERTYPADVTLRTPMGKVTLSVFSHYDILTVNEIFCREDYDAGPGDQVIVDFGSNIGISAAYFLTRSPKAFAYLFEPLPTNIERLMQNLKPFEGRFALSETAVGLEEGMVQFGYEDSGRYGGVGLNTGKYLQVRSVDSNAALDKVITKHGHIDLLKIDIETLEEPVLTRIPVSVLSRIKKIYVEYPFRQNPLAQTHSYRQYGTVAQFELKN